MPNYYLVRSPEVLVKDGFIGYGWGAIPFVEFDSANSLIEHMRSKKINLGRQEKQIRRFFNIQPGDIVIVPVSRAIYIAQAMEERLYERGVVFGENRIKVNFVNKEGVPVRIPRGSLTNQLSSRLKIRMSVVGLNGFGDEINKLIEQAKSLSLKEVGYRNAVQQFQEKAQAEFEAEFLAALRSGNVGLESGGYGLEKLIKELLVLEGYEASILGKNQGADISDIDIKATKNDWLGDQVLYVQAKHHKGHSDDHGIKQLKAIEDPNDQDHVVTKLFVTTGTLSDEAISLANEYDIRTLNGEELVKWLVERLDDLSADTKLLLGVVSVPQLHRYP